MEGDHAERTLRLAATAAALVILAASAFAAEEITAEKLLPAHRPKPRRLRWWATRIAALPSTWPRGPTLPLLYVQLPTAEDCAAACKAADGRACTGRGSSWSRGPGPGSAWPTTWPTPWSSLGDPAGRRQGRSAPRAAARKERPSSAQEAVDQAGSRGRRRLVAPLPRAGQQSPVARPAGPGPYLTQFIAEPRYAPAPQAAVASGGRVFMAFGHVAWHEREEPWLNTLVAINGLQRHDALGRPLTPGIMVDRSTMIATPRVLYLADDKSCKLLDAGHGPTSRTRSRAPARPGRRHVLEMDAPWRGRRRSTPWSARTRSPTPTPAGAARPTAGRGTASPRLQRPETPLGLRQDAAGHRSEDQEVLWTPPGGPAHRQPGAVHDRGRDLLLPFRPATCAASTPRPARTIWRRTAEKRPRGLPGDRPYRPSKGRSKAGRPTST